MITQTRPRWGADTVWSWLRAMLSSCKERCEESKTHRLSNRRCPPPPVSTLPAPSLIVKSFSCFLQSRCAFVLFTATSALRSPVLICNKTLGFFKVAQNNINRGFFSELCDCGERFGGFPLIHWVSSSCGCEGRMLLIKWMNNWLLGAVTPSLRITEMSGVYMLRESEGRREVEAERKHDVNNCHGRLSVVGCQGFLNPPSSLIMDLKTLSCPPLLGMRCLHHEVWVSETLIRDQWFSRSSSCSQGSASSLVFPVLSAGLLSDLLRCSISVTMLFYLRGGPASFWLHSLQSPLCPPSESARGLQLRPLSSSAP